MFGTNSGNNNNDVNVNTKIRTFFGEISCLQMTYWNDKISIKINPLQSVNADGIRQYDFNRRANTALSGDKCIALREKIVEKILPEMEKVKKGNSLEKPVNVGVSVGTNGSGIFIEYKNNDKGKPSAFLTVFTSVGQDNKANPEGTFSYKFEQIPVIENYNSDTGEGSISYIESEFLFFFDKIKNIADVSGSSAHSNNLENAYKSNRKQGSSYSNYNNPSNNSFGNNNQGFGNSNTNNNTAQLETYNMDDLPF